MSPVVTRVSQATRPIGSSFRTASRTASEIWSAILSGWPSVTDSEVKRKRSSACAKRFLQREKCDPKFQKPEPEHVPKNQTLTYGPKRVNVMQRKGLNPT